MADKDFAQVETTYLEHHGTSNSSSRVIIITVLATFFAIICFSIGFYMGEEHGVEASKGKKHEALIERLYKQKQELTALKEDAKKWQQQEASTSQVGELTFYNELPDQSINPEPLDNQPRIKDNSAFLDKLEADLAKSKYKGKTIETVSAKLEDIIKSQLQQTSRTFRIQIASFKEATEAERFLPTVQSLGIPAEIQRVQVSGRGIYYRVYTHSYLKEQEAIQAKSLIKQKLNIDGLMIQNENG